MNRVINILIFVLLLSSFVKDRNHNVGYYQDKAINYSIELEQDENQCYLSPLNAELNSIGEDDNELEKFHLYNEPSFIKAPTQNFNIVILTSSEFHCYDVILFESDTSPPSV